MAANYYFAALKPGAPADGLGAFVTGSGRCCYYSSGGVYFYEVGSGRAAILIEAGLLGWMVEQLAHRNAIYVDDARLLWLALASN